MSQNKEELDLHILCISTNIETILNYDEFVAGRYYTLSLYCIVYKLYKTPSGFDLGNVTLKNVLYLFPGVPPEKMSFILSVKTYN